MGDGEGTRDTQLRIIISYILGEKGGKGRMGDAVLRISIILM